MHALLEIGAVKNRLKFSFNGGENREGKSYIQHFTHENFSKLFQHNLIAAELIVFYTFDVHAYFKAFASNKKSFTYLLLSSYRDLK